jgi:hypothetical protein
MLNDDLEEVCPVNKLAKKLALSRPRFYQLQKVGVFPPPIYSIWTKRPMYPQSLQQVCMEIRRRGIGYNGLPVIFYSERSGKTDPSCQRSEGNYKEIANTLENFGIMVSAAKVKKAIGTVFPQGLAQHGFDGVALGKLCLYFKQGCKNDV